MKYWLLVFIFSFISCNQKIEVEELSLSLYSDFKSAWPTSAIHINGQNLEARYINTWLEDTLCHLSTIDKEDWMNIERCLSKFTSDSTMLTYQGDGGESEMESEYLFECLFKRNGTTIRLEGRKYYASEELLDMINTLINYVCKEGIIDSSATCLFDTNIHTLKISVQREGPLIIPDTVKEYILQHGN